MIYFSDFDELGSAPGVYTQQVILSTVDSGTWTGSALSLLGRAADLLHSDRPSSVRKSGCRIG